MSATMGSWGETVKALEMSKKTLPWGNTEEGHRVKRIDLCERRIQERELDPILMQYRDSNKEMTCTQKKSDNVAAVLQRANANRDKFNIISHQGPDRKLPPKNESAASSKVSLHLISNLPKKDHTVAPVLYSNDFYVSKFRAKENDDKPVARKREFDVISNKFYRNHDERQREDNERIKKDVNNKYWDSHNYDPLVGQYYCKDREDSFLEHRAKCSEVQGASQALRLPPSMYYSEGNSYNILNNSIKDQAILNTTLTTNTRILNKMKRTQVEENVHAVTEMNDKVVDDRKLGRVKYNRWHYQIERGFDPITNSVHVADSQPASALDPTTSLHTIYGGLSTTTVKEQQKAANKAQKNIPTTCHFPTPMPARPVSMWSRLHQPQPETISNNGAAVVSRSNTSDGRTGGRDLSGPKSNSIMDVVGGMSERVPQTNRSNNATSCDTLPSLSHTSRSTGGQTGRNSAVPKLDLTRTEPADNVSYNIPMGYCPPGQPIAMVRTGGFSAK